MSEVAGELDDAETRLLVHRLDQQLVGAVAAAVVDDDRLRVAVEQVHDARQAGDELLNHALFVVRRQDERVCGPGTAHAASVETVIGVSQTVLRNRQMPDSPTTNTSEMRAKQASYRGMLRRSRPCGVAGFEGVSGRCGVVALLE
jgi:hypothetical protein